MSSALVPVATTSTLPDASQARRLLEAFLSGRKATTLRSYRGDLADLAAFAGVADLEALLARLVAGSMGQANELAIRYRADLQVRALAPATINRRLAALRSLITMARALGFVPWTLEVEGLKQEAYRDTRGPGRQGYRRLLEQLSQRGDAKAVRDRAVLHLLYDLGLRRGEVVSLDVKDLDLDAGELRILGKGRTQKERLSLPRPTRQALEAWLAARTTLLQSDATCSTDPGSTSARTSPLFLRLDKAGKSQGRLNGSGIYQLVRRLGEASGIRARPHGLRHASITEALDRTHGDVRKVQKFSRHKKVETLLRYDDARQDLAGDVARLVAEQDGRAAG